MFTTKSAQSLKNLFAGYHEPLPMSKQQSQKLLDGVKSSFRKQLDREHGPSPRTKAIASHKASDPEPSTLSATNHHLSNILSNPLFSVNKTTTRSQFAAPRNLKNGDPMEVFDRAVARGMMTTRAATGCLMAKWKQVQAAEALGEPSHTDVSRRVAHWLEVSGFANDLAFLNDTTFVKVLAPFLKRERMGKLYWGWLRQAVEHHQTHGDAASFAKASNLLSALVAVKPGARQNIDAAISILLRAQDEFRDSPILSELLVQSWRNISWHSTHTSGIRAPSETLFDSHLATARVLPYPTEMECAHLHLYHPVHPSPKLALQFLNNVERVRELLNSAKLEGPSVPHHAHTWLMSLKRDTLSHLSEAGRWSEFQKFQKAWKVKTNDVEPADGTLSPA